MSTKDMVLICDQRGDICAEIFNRSTRTIQKDSLLEQNAAPEFIMCKLKGKKTYIIGFRGCTPYELQKEGI
jgi:hypothetical protein